MTIRSSKEYRELMQKVNNDLDFYTKTLEKATGKDKDIAQAEIQAVYLDVLRNTDDLVAMQRENIANLVMKQKLATVTKQELLKKAYENAEEVGDIEEIKQAESAMLEHVMNTNDDYKIFKAVNEGIKTLKGLEPKQITITNQNTDDGMVFDISDGVYTEE